MNTNITKLLSTEHTIAADIFRECVYPHTAIPMIKDFIIKLGSTLDKEKYDNPEKGIWIAKSARIAENAYIGAPCIIDEDAEIRHCAYIREAAIVGKNCVVGNSTELKNVILFDYVQVPHYNYVGDSILGYRVHLGAGALTSNFKMDKSSVDVFYGESRIKTGINKLGAIIGDFVEVGCGSVLNPGTVIGSNTHIYPLSSVRGYIQDNSIYKSCTEIAKILLEDGEAVR